MKDAAGNVSTCQNKVVVSDAFSVVILDGWALGSGCVLNTVYRGYKPAEYILLTAKVTGKDKYTYKWSNGSTAAFVLVNPQSATAYTVTVRDSKGCTQTALRNISVVDVRCGTKGDKVSLCYKGKAVCVEQKAVADYLLKGATLGACKGTTSRTIAEAGVMKSGYELTKAAAEHLEIEVAPNPSTTQFRLTLRSNNAKESITLTITDELGRMIETKVVAVGQPVQVGAKYRTGMYLAIATQGSQKAMVKLIKQY